MMTTVLSSLEITVPFKLIKSSLFYLYTKFRNHAAASFAFPSNSFLIHTTCFFISNCVVCTTALENRKAKHVFWGSSCQPLLCRWSLFNSHSFSDGLDLQCAEWVQLMTSPQSSGCCSAITLCHHLTTHT